MDKVEYYSWKDFIYKHYDEPIPKLKGIDTLDRDYRYWKQNKWKDSKSGFMKLDYWDKSFENQKDPPFYIYQYKDTDKLNPILKDKILKSNLNFHNKTTNIKAGVTTYNLFKENKEFNPLSKWVNDTLKNLSKTYYHMDPIVQKNKFKITHTDGWGAVYTKGEFTQPHSHFSNKEKLKSHWSWVYCVDVTNTCSPLTLTVSGKEIKPVNGRLIVFPIWVIHHVPKQTNEHARIVIAGNSSIRGLPTIK